MWEEVGPFEGNGTKCPLLRNFNAIRFVKRSPTSHVTRDDFLMHVTSPKRSTPSVALAWFGARSRSPIFCPREPDH